jgi:transposase
VYYLNDCKPINLVETRIDELRALCRQYDGFAELYAETQVRSKSLLALVFPHYEQVFSHVSCKTSLQVLAKYPTPLRVLEADLNDIIEALYIRTRSRQWIENQARRLLYAAKESQLNQTMGSSYEKLISMYVKTLRNQQEILADLRQNRVQWAQESYAFPLLLSIPGIGDLTATTILSEIEDIKRFPSSKQLVAFAGLDPAVFESGNFKSSQQKITKRGSTYLRKALYQATVAGISNRKNGPCNSILYEFYARKLAEGKPTKVAIVATSNKLLRMIYGIWHSNTPYKA